MFITLDPCAELWILQTSKEDASACFAHCTEHGVVAYSTNMWYYQCLINYSLTASTRAEQDCTSVVIFRIACAYVLCYMLYLPVAFTVALIYILCSSVFF